MSIGLDVKIMTHAHWQNVLDGYDAIYDGVIINIGQRYLHKYYDKGFYHHAEIGWLDLDKSLDMDFDVITHWAPLPKPPEDK